MFHKVKSVASISDFRCRVRFSEGVTMVYDVKPLFDKLPVFRKPRDDLAQLDCVAVDMGDYGIV